jgi:hypothetical protein
MTCSSLGKSVVSRRGTESSNLSPSSGESVANLSRARAASVVWPLPEDLDDAQLEALLFPLPPAIASDLPSMALVPENQVRTGLPAGAEGIRTHGPTSRPIRWPLTMTGIVDGLFEGLPEGETKAGSVGTLFGRYGPASRARVDRGKASKGPARGRASWIVRLIRVTQAIKYATIKRTITIARLMPRT